MKSLKTKFLVFLVAIVIAGSSMATRTMAQEEPPVCGGQSCYYKLKECLFNRNQKCTGNGTECGLQTSCSQS